MTSEISPKNNAFSFYKPGLDRPKAKLCKEEEEEDDVLQILRVGGMATSEPVGLCAETAGH